LGRFFYKTYFEMTGRDLSLPKTRNKEQETFFYFVFFNRNRTLTTFKIEKIQVINCIFVILLQIIF